MGNRTAHLNKVSNIAIGSDSITPQKKKEEGKIFRKIVRKIFRNILRPLLTKMGKITV